MGKGLIIGIDPGITTGIAILDVHGHLLSLVSKRDIKRNEIIQFIVKFGHPLIISSDVNPLPKSVETLASKLGCKVYYPEQSLSVSEKQELTRDFYDRIRNEHETDALAACIKAWKNYRDLFIKVENSLQRLGLSEFFEEVVIKLLKEESVNIDDAINEVLAQKRKVIPEIPKKMSVQEYQNMIEQLQKRLEQKEKIIKDLTQQSDSLNRALRRTREELGRAGRIRTGVEESDTIRKELEELKEANRLLIKFEKIENRDYYPIIEVDKVNSYDLEKLDKKISLEDRIILSNSLENLNLLNDFKIKALILGKLPENEVLEKLEFSIIPLEELSIKLFDDIKAVKKDEVERKLKSARKVGFVEWLKGYRKRKD